MSWFRSLVTKVSGNNTPTVPEQVKDEQPEQSAESARASLKETSSANVDKLKGLWALYINVRSEQERAQQLQKFLPLFHTLYDGVDFTVINLTFGDTKKLTRAVSQRLVKEVRQVWKPNSPKDANAKAVLRLLSTAHDDRCGYELLSVLKLICVGALNVEEATCASIPSTFVSLAHLFFSLPPGAADRMPKKKCTETMLDLLAYLCTFRYAVVELMKTDMLMPLFSMTCSDCPEHNAHLRASVGGVVSTVITNHTDREVTDYLFVKGTVRRQLELVREHRESLGIAQLTLIWQNITELLVASCAFSDTLLEEFNSGDGHKLLLEVLLWIEKQPVVSIKKSKEQPTPVDQKINVLLVEVVSKLVFVGPKTLSIPESISPYSNPVSEKKKYDMEKSVRNFKAFQVLQSYFLQSGNDDCQLRVLECMLTIYMDNAVNFLLLQQQHTLAHFFEEFENLTFKLKKKVLEMLLLVVTVLEYVPFQELSSLSCLLQENPSHDVVEHIYRVVNKLVSFDPLYKKIFQEAGMLVMLVNLLKRYHTFMTAIASEDSSTAVLEFTSKVYTEQDQPEVVASYTVTMDCIELLLSGVDENVQIFRDSGCVQILFSLLYNRDTRPSALQIMKVLIVADKSQEYRDIAGLIEIMQASPRKNFEMKRDILTSLCNCFEANERTKSAFREAGGFICTIRLLAGLEEPRTSDGSRVVASPETSEFKKELIGTLFRTITGSIAHHSSNRKFFREQIVFTLSGCLKLTGILPTLHAFNVLDSLLCIATETVSSSLLDPEKLLVFNPEVLIVIFELFPETQMEVRIAILQRILQVISIGKRNQEPLCSIGLLEYVETHFEGTLQDSASPLHPLLLKFIVQLAMHRITPGELRKIIRLLQNDGAPMSLLGSLHHMAAESTPPYVEFDMMHSSDGGFACLHLLSFGDRSWPPANGYTFSCWMFIDLLGDSGQQIDIVSFVSDDKRSCTRLFIHDGKFVLSTSSKSQVEFPVDIQPKGWYHLTITQSRHRFAGGSEAKLYVNGELEGTAKSPYLASASCNVSGYLGTSAEERQPQDLVWRLGPCYLIEEVFTWEKVLTTYCLGPHYGTNFQGSFKSFASYDVVNSRTLRLLQQYDSSASGLGPIDLEKTDFSVSEDRIIFSLNAHHVVFDESGAGTVIVNAADSENISKAVLSGGATALAFSGLASSLSKIGGVAVIFFLIENATTTEALLCAVELLVVLIRNSARLSSQIERLRGYELLGSFLYQRQLLLSTSILESVFELCGVAVPSKLQQHAEERTPVLSNMRAFAGVVMNYSIWRWTPIEVQKLYFRRINLLLVNNPQSLFNAGRLRELKLLPKLLTILQDESLDHVLVDWVGNVINNLVALGLLEEDLQALSAFLVGTLQPAVQVVSNPNQGNLTARRMSIRRRRTTSVKRPSPTTPRGSPSSGSSSSIVHDVQRPILVRNIVLETVVNLMMKTDVHTIFLKVIQPKWLFLFITRDQDSRTVTLAVKALVVLLQGANNGFKGRFEAENGFRLLEKILPMHCDNTDIYYLLICSLIGKPVVDLPAGAGSLQLSYTDLFTTFRPKDFKSELGIECDEMLGVLLKILRKCCAGSRDSDLMSFTNKYAEHCGLSPVIHRSLSSSSTNSLALTPMKGKQKKSRGSSASPPAEPSSPEKQAPSLRRWDISDKDQTIQVAIIEFLSYLFDNCSDLREAFWGDKKGSLIHHVVSTLYPHGYLNFPVKGGNISELNASPSSGQAGTEHEEAIKCHQSAELLFEFLSHMLIMACKTTSKMMTLFETVLDSAPWKEVKGAMMDMQAQKTEEAGAGMALPPVDYEYALFQNKLLCDFVQFVSKNVTRDVFLENRCLASNIAKFCPFLVDKVAAGLFPNGGVLVFEFLVELLERIENFDGESDSVSTVPRAKYKLDLMIIYKSLNRIVIHLLGASYGKTRDDFADIIQTVLAHHRVALNTDQDYIFVLCYLLYKFLLDDNRKLRETAQNAWKLLLEEHEELMNDILICKPSKDTVINLKENGFDLLLKQDYTNFVCWMGDVVQSGELHTVVHEPLSKAWLAWKEPETRNTSEMLKQQQIRRQVIQEKNLRSTQEVANSMSELEAWRTKTTDAANETNYKHFKSMRQRANDRHRFIEVYWTRLKAQLVRERSLWENAAGSTLDRWKLDTTEGPYRMRKKLKRNFKFFSHYPYVRGIEEGGHCVKIPTSKFCKEHFEQHGGRVVDITAPAKKSTKVSFVSLDSDGSSEGEVFSDTSEDEDLGEDEEEEEAVASATLSPRVDIPSLKGASAFPASPNRKGGFLGTPISPASPVPQKLLLALQRSSSFGSLPKVEESVLDEEEDEELSSDEEDLSEEFEEEEDLDEYDRDAVLNIQRLLDYGDLIVKMYNCGRVDGMIKRDGVLLLCTSAIYLIDDYRVVDGEIEEIPAAERSLAASGGIAEGAWNTSLSNGGANCGEEKAPGDAINGHHSRKWAYEDIRDLFKRRYLLRTVALELFSTDGRNFLFVFDIKDVDSVHRAISFKLPRAGAHSLEEISGNRIGRLTATMDDGTTSGPRLGVMTKLFRRDITHKWTQGQISNFQYLMHLNTLAGRSYNDLTQYPIFPWILSDYESETLDLTDESVYRDLSKPMGALGGPRAEEFRERYDNWDPYENNGVPKWHYGSHYSSAGIVLYYLIRMEPFTQQFLNFLQSGRFDVADRLFHSLEETWKSASGDTMNMSDVKELIPEFFYLSEFLCNENKFDMGRKQSTDEVVDDIVLPPWAKGDAREFVRLHRAALESEYVSAHLHEWIDLIFGYKQQGPAAEAALNVFYYLTYEGSVDIDLIEDPIEKDSVIAQINNFGQTPTKLFKKPHPRRVVTSYTNSRLLDVLTSPRSTRLRVKEIGEAVGFILQVNERLVVAGQRTASLPTMGYSKVLSWGHMDYSVRILNVETGKVAHVIENLHDGQVTAACATQDGRYLITGGADTMISVLKVTKVNKQRNFSLLRNLCGHLQEITCLAVCRSYSIIVSGSKDGTCIVWDLNKLRLVRQLRIPAAEGHPITAVSVNNITGAIAAVTGPFFHVWSLNGEKQFTHRACDGNLSITAFAMTEEADWLGIDYLTGLTDGTIRLWSYSKRDGSLSSSMLLQCQGKAHSCAITSLYIAADNKRCFSGDESGRVIQWSEDVET